MYILYRAKSETGKASESMMKVIAPGPKYIDVRRMYNRPHDFS